VKGQTLEPRYRQGRVSVPAQQVPLGRVGGAAVSTPAKSTAEQAATASPFSFGFADLVADVQGTREVAGNQVALGVQMPYPGSVVAVGFRSSAAKTAGTVSFTVWIAGQASDAIAVWDTISLGDVARFTPGLIVFEAGDELYPYATLDGFAPTTADVEVIVYVSFSSGV